MKRNIMITLTIAVTVLPYLVWVLPALYAWSSFWYTVYMFVGCIWAIVMLMLPGEPEPGFVSKFLYFTTAVVNMISFPSCMLIYAYSRLSGRKALF